MLRAEVDEVGKVLYMPRCRECRAAILMKGQGEYTAYESAEAAAAAWNTRHAETCKVVGSYYSELMDVYVFSLSCGDSIWWNDEEPPKFCPECGRKVEG